MEGVPATSTAPWKTLKFIEAGSWYFMKPMDFHARIKIPKFSEHVDDVAPEDSEDMKFKG